MKRRKVEAAAGTITVKDMPDALLRHEPPITGDGLSRMPFREHQAARQDWLSAHGLQPTWHELDAERRRRWPVVDRIVYRGRSR